MDSEQIKRFLVTARYSSFTDAARELYVSQPTISKQIHALEEELQVTLFERSGPRIRLTREGELYVECFEEIAGILDYYNALIHQETSYETPHLRIGVLEGLDVIEHLRPVLDLMEESGEQVETSLSFLSHRNLNMRLANRTIDVGVTLSDEILNNTSFEYIILAQLEHGLAAHKSIDIATDGQLDLEKIRRQEFYIAKDGSLGFRQYFSKLSARFGLDEARVHYVPNIESQILSLESGVGISGVSFTPRGKNNPNLNFYPDDFTTIRIVAAWSDTNKSRAKELFARSARRYSRERRRL